VTSKRITEQPEVVQRLKNSFPSSLSDTLNTVFQIIPSSESHYLRPTDDDIGTVYISGEQVHIPYRFYSPEPEKSDTSNLTNQQLTILACIYSRHNNGYIRQNYVQTLCHSNQEWVPPFVIQLLSEYVIEIHYEIEKYLSDISAELYSTFASGNQVFLHSSRSRIINYWSIYYRRVSFKEYPAFRVLKSMELWNSREGRSLLLKSSKI
jgi:hypothetical protein